MLYLRAYNVSQFIKILIGKIPVIPITSLYIFLDTMQIQAERLQQFTLKGRWREEKKLRGKISKFHFQTYAINAAI